MTVVLSRSNSLICGNHLVGQGGIQVGITLPDDFRCSLLVGRIQVREQEADGQGLRPLPHQVVQVLNQRGLVQRALHLAAGADALGDAHAQIAGGQRLNHGHAQVVAVLFEALPHLQQVAEAVGGDQADRGALAFHQRVGGHGGPVDHQVGVAQELVQRQPVGIGGVLQSGHDADGRVVGGGRGLEETWLSAFAGHDEISECTPDVYPDFVHLWPPDPFGGNCVLSSASYAMTVGFSINCTTTAPTA